MRLLFDTSVWVEHLRHDVLTPIIPALRGKFMLGIDAVSAAELRAGCRSRSERQGVDRLLAPFEKAGRVAVPEAGDYVRAGEALSRLRERGKTLTRPAGALLDAPGRRRRLHAHQISLRQSGCCEHAGVTQVPASHARLSSRSRSRPRSRSR